MSYLGMVSSLESIAGESAVECRPDLRSGLTTTRILSCASPKSDARPPITPQ
jgi:hypothetical protein